MTAPARTSAGSAGESLLRLAAASVAALAGAAVLAWAQASVAVLGGVLVFELRLDTGADTVWLRDYVTVTWLCAVAVLIPVLVLAATWPGLPRGPVGLARLPLVLAASLGAATAVVYLVPQARRATALTLVPDAGRSVTEAAVAGIAIGAVLLVALVVLWLDIEVVAVGIAAGAIVSWVGLMLTALTDASAYPPVLGTGSGAALALRLAVPLAQAVLTGAVAGLLARRWRCIRSQAMAAAGLSGVAMALAYAVCGLGPAALRSHNEQGTLLVVLFEAVLAALIAARIVTWHRSRAGAAPGTVLRVDAAKD